MAMWSIENFGFVRDIRTKFRGKFILDLYLIILISVLMIVLTYTPFFSDSIFRAILAFPATLFAPGYAMVTAMFPRRSDMGNIARMTMSVTLSIIIVPLIGMALNYTFLGVHLDPILICVTIFTLACSALAIVSRFKVPADEMFYPDIPAAVKSLFWGDRSQIDKVLGIAIVAALLVSAGTVSYMVFMPGQVEQFTEFYLTGPEHNIGGYPSDFVLGEQLPVIVGIVNHEKREMTYDLQIQLVDNNTTTVLSTERVVLGDNQTWEKTAQIKPDRLGTRMKLDFLLYADGNTAIPYHQCRLWINVTDQRKNTTASAGNTSMKPSPGAR
ncbi:DUF1616 domain-containing protein [Methanocella arvoryzae]|uniref:DUF1616 domain-containing protein n=1 Tax=Methanocella arvoryzae (strain DSM 22066 / NBRC 105507 / MRE50) TaxID=351160 RepID=Q0W7D0_METAR|nr:DUF1616 domain-containing protein [Methanocella arvoryzae]CAJ35713.1 conserved hypothetical protein [Methanocella arvoryzae MRE50]